MLTALSGCHDESNTQPARTITSKPRVILTTTKGDIIIELDVDRVPQSANHFLQLVDRHTYDNTRVHQVLDKRYIAAGRDRADGTPLPLPPNGIRNEWSKARKNTRGTVTLIRREGDPRNMSQGEMVACQNSAWSAFLINTRHNAQLDMRRVDGAGFTAIGVVVEGMDVVDAIADTATQRNATIDPPEPGEPVEAIIIESAQRVADER